MCPTKWPVKTIVLCDFLKVTKSNCQIVKDIGHIQYMCICQAINEVQALVIVWCMWLIETAQDCSIYIWNWLLVYFICCLMLAV